MKSLTVFTTTYNRAYCLHQCYESLCRQTSQDFVWMIVDDGSTDNTKQIVGQWILENKIEIEYYYKDNGGMHTGHNTAYANIQTELNVCIDSDDFMPDDAVEKIVSRWRKCGSDLYAGMIGLDIYKDGSVVGTSFPEGVDSCSYDEIKGRYGVVGDLKFVLRTDVVRQFAPYPEYADERFVPLGYLYMLISTEFEYLCSNDVYCVVEYMPDGSSKNIFRQYIKNPKGFAHERVMRMKYSSSIKEVLRNAVHYVSSSIFAGNRRFLRESPRKLATLFALPFGVMLNLYIRNFCRRTYGKHI